MLADHPEFTPDTRAQQPRFPAEPGNYAGATARWVDRAAAPLSGKWNGHLDFVVDQEDIGQHPRGLGDCANLATSLYLIANPKALEVLTPFFVGTAELLPATLHGERVTVVNVTRCIPPDQLGSVDPNDVFRVGPVGLDIFVGVHVRDAARAAGITGLAFVPVRATDAVQMI